MTHNKTFWLINNIGLSVFYLAVLVFYWGTGAAITHPAVLLALVILGFHVLEIPLALKILADKQPSTLRVIIATTLFGFTWWLPAKRGIYSVA